MTELSYRITAAAAAEGLEWGKGGTPGSGSKDAHVYISYQSRSTNDAHTVRQALSKQGFMPTDLSHNEMVRGRSYTQHMGAPFKRGHITAQRGF